MTSRALTHQQRFGTIRDMLEKSRDRIGDVLPRHMTPERLIRVALAATSRTPQLLQCSPKSLVLAVMHAAQLGLEAGSPLGSAYLVPYRNKNGGYDCQLIVGYRGLIDLARRSGDIMKIEARIVHKKDSFKCLFGTENELTHEPYLKGDAGEVTAVYAVAKLRDGDTQVEVMTREQIDGIRNRSRAGRSGPWVTDYEEMARKTVVRRLAKYLPLSPEMNNALDLDARAEMGDSGVDIIDIELPEEVHVEAAEPQSRNDEVRAMLAKKIEEEPQSAAEIVASSHGKTAKKLIEETWSIATLEEMQEAEANGKNRDVVLDAISSQLDLAARAAADGGQQEIL